VQPVEDERDDVLGRERLHVGVSHEHTEFPLRHGGVQGTTVS
jgi:hypothetical protein